MPPRKAGTLDSYNLRDKKTRKKGKDEKKKGDNKKKQSGFKKKKGRPSSVGKTRSARKDNYMSRCTKEDLEAAYIKVTEEGWTKAKAVRELRVPRLTLVDRLSGKHQTGKIGRPPVLSP
jgi:hypothetical protein